MGPAYRKLIRDAEEAILASEININECYSLMDPYRAWVATKKAWRLYKAQLNFLAALRGEEFPCAWRK